MMRFKGPLLLLHAKLAHRIVRVVRILTKLEAHNLHLKRKLQMLSHKHWRDLVLKELGGMRKLKLWEAAQKRAMRRIAESAEKPHKPAPTQDPPWLYTAERMAESERLKARVRMCARACRPGGIVRGPYKVDFDGQFRLPPLPRRERAARQMKIYTQATISDYEFNAIPFEKELGFGPAIVWPVEFYAAIAIENEILAEQKSKDEQSAVPPKRDWHGIPTVPLDEVLDHKTRRDLFIIPMWEETPSAFQ